MTTTGGNEDVREGAREILRIVTAHKQREGGGFVVRRPFPSYGLTVVDPFLLIDEMGPVDHYDPSILNKLGGNGARLIGPADRRELLNAGLLGNEAKTIVAAPLEHEDVAFGVLLAGQEKPNSEARQGNGGFSGIGSFARSVAPDLHAWLLLRGIREQLASRRTAEEQATSHAESESPPPPDHQSASSDHSSIGP